jgi:hypothetical protein
VAAERLPWRAKSVLGALRIVLDLPEMIVDPENSSGAPFDETRGD